MSVSGYGRESLRRNWRKIARQNGSELVERALDVNFQDVVHSVLSREADVSQRQ